MTERPGVTGSPEKTGVCANCGAALAGAYCAACGQSAQDIRRPILSLASEAADGLFTWDGRLFATFRRLYTRPGRVGRDYVEGRRAAHTPPIKLYLLVSLVFFLATALIGVRVVAVTLSPDAETIRAQDADIIALRRERLETFAEELEADTTGLTRCGVEPGPDEIADNGELIYARDTGVLVNLFQFGDPSEARRLNTDSPACAQIENREGWLDRRNARLAVRAVTDPAGFEARINAAAGQAMFVMVAGFALICLMLHPRRRIIEHLIHALYLHAAFLPVIALVLAAIRLFGPGTTGGLVAGGSGVLAFLALIYLYDRGFYGSSWWGAALRLPVLVFGYVIAIGLASVILLVLQTY